MMPAAKLTLTLNQRVPLEEALSTLDVAKLAVESLYGVAQTRLESSCEVDQDGRSLTIDERGESGRALARIFAGLLIREFGDEAFVVANR
jgi:hypothetical protein